jgi:hypothetical protein
MLEILNRDRVVHHVAPLRLNRTQTFGAGRCLGSLGHSRAMARTGQIWHINHSFPRASFPNNICGSYATYGQNVGSESATVAPAALRDLDNLMMAEPHSRKFCSSSHFNHACNILDPSFHTVGIGVYLTNGSIWLTEDFTS